VIFPSLFDTPDDDAEDKSESVSPSPEPDQPPISPERSPVARDSDHSNITANQSLSESASYSLPPVEPEVNEEIYEDESEEWDKEFPDNTDRLDEALTVSSSGVAPSSLITGTPSSSVRLMHFADVHLGIETHGKPNPETGINSRVEDFTISLHQSIDVALTEGVDIAIFAGDAYKVRDPNQTHQRAFAGGLRRLTEAGVPVVMLVGNHDLPNSRGRAHALEIYGLLSGAGVFILQDPDIIVVPTRKGEVLVAGMPYLTRSRVAAHEDTRGKSVEEVAGLISDRYAADIARLAEQVTAFPQHIAILTGHFTVANARVGIQGALIAPAEPQVPVEALALPRFSYVAMGHIHKYQDMNRGLQPPVVYAGSIDRVDFGEKDETKGFVIADLAYGQPTMFRHITLETRPFVDISIDVGDSADPTGDILQAIHKRRIAGAIVRLTYRASPERFALVRVDEIKNALDVAQSFRIHREIPPAEASPISQEFAQALTPEKALALYLEHETRLTSRKAEFLAAAAPLFEILAHEEAALA